jgi:hypothetical protein
MTARGLFVFPPLGGLMTAHHDPDRVAAVGGALDRLLNLLAGEVARELIRCTDRRRELFDAPTRRSDHARSIDGDHDRPGCN